MVDFFTSNPQTPPPQSAPDKASQDFNVQEILW